ncbi:MAG: outer membrane beta-barrel protein [Rhodobacteraceae bacterium]|nr:outer membrane beta-barrel protein [Paracoccaceae bacterium]
MPSKFRFSLKAVSKDAGLALALATGLGGTVLTRPASAELVLSFYTGANWSPNSRVDYDFNLGGGPQSTNVAWDGEPFVMPPYFGMRATWWFENSPNWGVAIDNVHAKVAANPLPGGLAKLEFTDGINIVTANVHYRHLNSSRFTPYAGIGIGFTTPHVEVMNTAGTSRTFEYQFGGPAVQALVGVESKLNDRWSVFGELKAAYVKISADLNGGGSLKTNIRSNQVAFGVSYKFKKW